MRSFIEKIKDILYDGIDYILMVGIIVAIAFIINWKIDGLFAISDVNELHAQSSEASEESSQEEENNHTNTPAQQEEKDNSSNEDQEDKPANEVEENSNSSNGSNQDKEANEEEVVDKGNEEVANSNEKVTINIPAGSLPGDIGNILASQGLVSSRDEFLKKVRETNTEKKLRYGKFEIAKNASVDEIIRVLIQ